MHRVSILLLAAAAVHCGSSPGASAAWVVNMGGGGSCSVASSASSFGDSALTATAVTQRVTDKEVVKSTGQAASVACAVIPLSGGAFEIQAQTLVGSESLDIDIAKVDPTATQDNPAEGTVTFLSSTGDSYSGQCNFYFANSSEGVGADKFWATFTCSAITTPSPPSTCAVAESYIALANCGTSPL